MPTEDYINFDLTERPTRSNKQPAEVVPSIPAPKIVCLCGSTRFYEEFMYANYAETMKGNIVLSVGVFGHRPVVHRVPRPGESKDPKFQQPDGHIISLSAEDKIALDELHKRKIDLAHEVFVVNPGGYIGDSTRSEIAYATVHGKPIRYMVEPEGE